MCAAPTFGHLGQSSGEPLCRTPRSTVFLAGALSPSPRALGVGRVTATPGHRDRHPGHRDRPRARRLRSRPLLPPLRRGPFRRTVPGAHRPPRTARRGGVRHRDRASATSSNAADAGYQLPRARVQTAIRNRVLNTVMSTWGGRAGQPDTAGRSAGNGEIRMATWSSATSTMQGPRRGPRPRSQRAGRRSAEANIETHLEVARASWPARYGPGQAGDDRPELRPPVPWRLPRGRWHSALEVLPLRQRQGSRPARTSWSRRSMNLTTFAFQGQWNQARACALAAVYNSLHRGLRAVRIGLPVSGHPALDLRRRDEHVLPAHQCRTDPVMQTLNRTRCTGARPAESRVVPGSGSSSTPSTDRGTSIAKGCAPCGTPVVTSR